MVSLRLLSAAMTTMCGHGISMAAWLKAGRRRLAPIVASPAWGDVDGDGVAELVAGSDDGSVYAWHANGERVAGWPKMASASVKGAVAFADLDSDPTQELVVGDFAGSLNVWNLTYPQYLRLFHVNVLFL